MGSNVINALKWQPDSWELWLIIEIYRYFAEQLKEVISCSISTKSGVCNDEDKDECIECVASLISGFILDDFSEDYKVYTDDDAQLRRANILKFEKLYDSYSYRLDEKFALSIYEKVLCRIEFPLKEEYDEYLENERRAREADYYSDYYDYYY